MKNLLTTLLVFLAINTIAQDKGIEVIGEVINSETREAIPYVHVVNKSTGDGTAGNSSGRFWITVEPQDTLLFSAIGFETYQVIVKENTTSNKLLLTIELSQSTMELEAVKVFAFKDEYALKRALIDTELPIETEKQGIKLPGVNYGPRRDPNEPLRLGGPLTAIGNLFSKEQKELKKLDQLKKETNSFFKTQSKYNPTLVMELTGLPEDKIEDFMEFCKVDEGFVAKATEYEIAVVIQECLTDYKQRDQ